MGRRAAPISSRNWSARSKISSISALERSLIVMTSRFIAARGRRAAYQVARITHFGHNFPDRPWQARSDVVLSARRARSPISLGSIPFGLMLTRLAGLGDIRAIGSGNIGATNVLRTGNKGLAAATLAARPRQGRGRRAGRRGTSAPTRRRSPRPSRSSAISSRSGCASTAARASRPPAACCSPMPGRSALAARRHLARDGGGDALFLARRDRRRPCWRRSTPGSSRARSRPTVDDPRHRRCS